MPINVAPVVLVKNEEIWIGRVLKPLLSQFGIAIVGDTGSTDSTRDEVASLPGVELIEFGPLDMKALGQARRELGRRAIELGCEWIMQVDGDELYHPQALALIAEHPVPEGGKLGFTTMITLDPDPDGSVWLLEDVFARAAIMPADVGWAGEYPFEAPVVFGRQEGFFYYPVPEGLRWHALHLHRFQRSPHDDAVIYRQQKQHQFAMRDKTVPRAGRFDPEGWW